MPGKYLRKRIPGRPQDPTMTHVDDPFVFRPGDFIRDRYGYSLIAAIDDAALDNPDIRFAYLVDVSPSEPLPSDAVIHDVRMNDAETARLFSD
jgi:hypothetical protein